MYVLNKYFFVVGKIRAEERLNEECGLYQERLVKKHLIKKTKYTLIFFNYRNEFVKLYEDDKKEIRQIQRNGHTYKIGVITVPSFYNDMEAASSGNPNNRSTTHDVHRLLHEPLRPFDDTNEAYKLGINYLIYGMTH